MQDEIKEISLGILKDNPSHVVRYRLMRDVLQRPLERPELIKARKKLNHSQMVQQLAKEQRQDGSWGHFHSRDSQAKRKILTTEFGVERALALGLDRSHPVLQKAESYTASSIFLDITPV